MNQNKNATSLVLSAILALNFFVLSSASAAECNQTVFNIHLDLLPDYSITYQDGKLPEWKKIWDLGRELLQQKKFDKAQVQYELLLSLKDNIDQARWEYAAILTGRQQWQKAETELAVLIAHEPDRPEYQLAAAEISLRVDDFSLAVKLFSRLYQQFAENGENHCVDDKVRILSGYITALDGIGNDEKILPLIEQLVVLQPKNDDLQKRVAALVLNQNQYQKALVMYSRLKKDWENDQQKEWQEDQEILEGLASVNESLGNRDESAVYLQQLVGLDKDNREAHARLVEYYHWIENRAMELKHLEILITLQGDDCGLMELAARLHLEFERPDRALEYYNRLLTRQPDNLKYGQQKEKVLHQVAVQLVALVENSGSDQLWQDLVQITEDRVGIYRAISRILREQGRWDELFQVLQIIQHEVPGDVVTDGALTDVFKEQAWSNTLVSSRNVDAQDSVIRQQ